MYKSVPELGDCTHCRQSADLEPHHDATACTLLPQLWDTSIDFIKLIFININIYALYRRRNVSSRFISNYWWNNTNVMAMGWFWFVFWQQYNSRLTIKKFSFLKQWWCSSCWICFEGHIYLDKDKDKDKEFLFPMQQVFPLLQRQDRGQWRAKILDTIL